jgi:hypothetical protein
MVPVPVAALGGCSRSSDPIDGLGMMISRQLLSRNDPSSWISALNRKLYEMTCGRRN